MKNLNDFIKENNNNNKNFDSKAIISDLVDAKINPENCYIIGTLSNPKRLFLLEDLGGMDCIFICITLCAENLSIKINKFPVDFFISAFAGFVDITNREVNK